MEDDGGRVDDGEVDGGLTALVGEDEGDAEDVADEPGDAAGDAEKTLRERVGDASETTALARLDTASTTWRPSTTAACIREVSLAPVGVSDLRIALEALSGEEFAVKVTVRARSYNNGQKIWTADLHVVPFGEEVVDRFRLTCPANITSRSGAERWGWDQAKAIMAKGRPPGTRKGRADIEKKRRVAEAQRVPTLREWWADYIADCEAERRKPATIVAKGNVFRRWLEPELGDKDLQACSSELEVRRLRGRLVSVGPRRVNQVIDTLLTCLRAAAKVRPELNLRVPVIKPIKVEADDDEIRCYSPEQVTAILAACRDLRERAAVLLMVDLGLRAGEVCALRWPDVAFEAREVTVRATLWCPRGKPPELVSPKSGKTRRLPLTSRTAATLAELRAQAGSIEWVVPAVRTNGPRTYPTLADTVFWLCKRAGVPHLGAHAFRHTFATSALRAGVDLRTLQKLLGHAQIEVTARYLHPGSSRDAADKLEALMTSEPTIATVTPLTLARQRRTAAAR